MQVRRGARTYDAAQVGNPADARAVSGILSDVDVALNGGCVEIATQFGRVFARPGQWITVERATGALAVLDSGVFAARFEAV